MPAPKSKKTEQQASEPEVETIEVETTEVISYPEGTLGNLIDLYDLRGSELPLGVSSKGKPYCIVDEGIIFVFLASNATVKNGKAVVTKLDNNTPVVAYQAEGSETIVYTIGSNLSAGTVSFNF